MLKNMRSWWKKVTLLWWQLRNASYQQWQAKDAAQDQRAAEDLSRTQAGAGERPMWHL
jgi:hypothetical protein